MEKNGLIFDDTICPGRYFDGRVLLPYPTWQRLTCQLKSPDDFCEQAHQRGIGYIHPKIQEVSFPFGEEVEFAIVTDVNCCLDRYFFEKNESERPATTGVTLKLDYNFGLIGSYLIPENCGLTFCPDWLGPQLRLAFDCQPSGTSIITINHEFVWELERRDEFNFHSDLMHYGQFDLPYDRLKGKSFVLARKKSIRKGESK